MGKITPCLKPVKTMLETSNLACKDTLIIYLNTVKIIEKQQVVYGIITKMNQIVVQIMIT